VIEQDLKPILEAAFDQTWSDFAEAHPRLAEVLSAPTLLASATRDLRNDAAYRKAIDDAVLAGAAMDVLDALVTDHLRKWFARLV
jgi:hypothetical protein